MIFQVSFIFSCFPSWVWTLKPAKTWKIPDRLAAPQEKRAPNFCNLPWEISGRSCFTCFPSWFSTKMHYIWRHDTAWRLMGDYKNWVHVWRQSMRELIITFLRLKIKITMRLHVAFNAFIFSCFRSWIWTLKPAKTWKFWIVCRLLTKVACLIFGSTH